MDRCGGGCGEVEARCPVGLTMLEIVLSLIVQGWAPPAYLPSLLDGLVRWMLVRREAE